MADLFEIFGIDEEYDSRFSKWIWTLFAKSKDDDEFLREISNRLSTMSQLDAFLSGMFINAYFLHRALLNNPQLVYDQAERFFRTYCKYRKLVEE